MSDFEDEDDSIFDTDEIVLSVSGEELEEITNKVAAENALVVYRINPPPSLTEAEVAIWDRVLSSVVAGWLGEKDIEQLAGYCRAWTSIEFYNEQMQVIKNDSGFDPTDKAFYQSYAKWAELSAKAEGLLITYARSMRITNQAFRSDETRVSNVKKDSKELWEDE